MKNGEKAKSGKFLQFFKDIKEAEGKAAFEWLDKIEKAANENWQAAAWKLERRYPGDYGRTRVEHTGEGGGPIIVVNWDDTEND